MKFNIPRRRFRCRAERPHVVESAKWVTPPPAAPREAWREERRLRRRSERRARHAERRGESSEPHQSKPHWGTQTLPHHIFPLRAPHARPAGGGTNAFCFLSLVAPAPPGSRNCPFPARAGEILRITAIHPPRAIPAETTVPRPARAEDKRFPRNSTRAPAIKDNRFPLYKHSVSTYPLPLTPAFLQPSASGERSDSPRPCLKKQGRRGRAFPWGGSSLPEGRAFRIPFPSSGKVSPARGAHNKQLLLVKNHKQNFKAPANEKTINYSK